MHAVQQSDAAEQTLLEFYRRVRARTEELCRPLEIEDYIPQPIVDVSPPKWNIAHTTWFFEEMILKKFIAGYEPFDPAFGFLFNSYYNSIGDRTARDRRGDISRPTVKQVFEFRKYVDERMSELLTETADIDAALSELVTLGLNHEQQHQELFLTDLKYTFSTNPLFPVYDASFAQVEDIETAAQELIEMPAGIYEIGFAGKGFCFDNELGRHRVFLEERLALGLLCIHVAIAQEIEDTEGADACHEENEHAHRRGGPDMPLTAGKLHVHQNVVGLNGTVG